MSALKFELLPGEEILRQGKLNHWEGPENVRGDFYLTSRRLVFISGSFTFQKHKLFILLEDIVEVKKYMTMGIAPNGMFVLLKSGKKEKFQTWKRQKWIRDIGVMIEGLV